MPTTREKLAFKIDAIDEMLCKTSIADPMYAKLMHALVPYRRLKRKLDTAERRSAKATTTGG